VSGFLIIINFTSVYERDPLPLGAVFAERDLWCNASSDSRRVVVVRKEINNLILG